MPISITVHYCNVSVVKFQKMSSSSSSGISGITCGENCIAIHTVICCKTFPCAIPPHNCAFHIGSFNFILEEEAKLKDFEAILIEALKNKGFTDLRLSKMRLLNIQKMPERYLEVLYVDISYQPDSEDTVKLNVQQLIKNWPKNLQWNLEEKFSKLVDMWIEFENKLISMDQKIDNFDWKLTPEETESR
mgnify:FL=1